MAQTTGIINGSDLLLYINGVPIAHAVSHTISSTVEEKETLTKQNKGSAGVMGGKVKHTVSCDHLYAFDGDANGYSLLFGKMNSRTLVTLKMATTNNNNKRYVGQALITSLELNFPVEEGSSYSAVFSISEGLSEETGS